MAEQEDQKQASVKPITDPLDPAKPVLGHEDARPDLGVAAGPEQPGLTELPLHTHTHTRSEGLESEPGTVALRLGLCLFSWLSAWSSLRSWCCFPLAAAAAVQLSCPRSVVCGTGQPKLNLPTSCS